MEERIDMLVSDSYYTRGGNPTFDNHVPSANLPEANSTFWCHSYSTTMETDFPLQYRK
jgi:hypothetical protein